MARRKYARRGFFSPEIFLGMVYGGRLNQKLLNDLLERLPEGKTTEIMTHPGHFDQSSMQIYEHWGYRGEEELSSMCLCSKKTLESQRQVKMISYEEAGNG